MNIWQIVEGVSYPTLKWQSQTADEGFAYELSLQVQSNTVEETADVTATVTKLDSAVPNGILIIALYNTADNDELIDVIIVENVSSNTYDVTLPFAGYGNTDALIVKGFIWNSLDDIEPMAISETYTL